MSIQSKIATGFVSLAAGLLASCGNVEPQAPPQAKVVGVYTLESKPINLTVDLPGRTVAYRLAEVRPQVSGIIEKRLFVEGAEVEAGQQLYQIEDERYRATYQRALANLDNAKAQLSRYEELLDSGSVSKQQYDDVDAAYKLAEAEAELARIDLEHTEVVAPVTGRIGRSAVSEGALVSEAQTAQLSTIQQIDPIYVDITQPVVEMLRLQEAMDSGALESDSENGAKVSLLLDNGRVFDQTGSLRFSEVSVDQGTGSVTLRAVIPNPEGRLLPGMFVHARLNQGRKNDAILLPQQAVQRDASGKPATWVIGDDKKAELRSIQVHRAIGNMWLVENGVKAGEQVVTEGIMGLQAGVEVEPVPASNVNPVLDFNEVASN